MMVRRLVFLGPTREAGVLAHEGSPLEPAQALPLLRKRSPWRRHRGVERVILGSHAARADVLLAGEGIHPEHVRLYMGEDPGAPVELLVIHGQSTRVNGQDVEPRAWTRLQGGDEVELGPWRFRFVESTE